jgi:dephospho-CoA kinase
MYLLGIVGGVASGKSFVASELQQLGAEILNADAAGHAVLCDPAVIAAFRERWGEAVLSPTGEIVRAEVARRVFGSEDSPAAEERAFLNQITHPRIRARLESTLAEYRQQQQSLVVLDAALLFETNWNTLCQGILFIDSPREQRLARALSRGWSAEQFAAREAAQWPVEEKRRRATWVLENAGSQDDLRSKLRDWYQSHRSEFV